MKRQTREKRRFGHEKLEYRMLLAVDGFAPFDGFGNNVGDPELGAADEQFDRLAPAAYEDGVAILTLPRF